MKYFEVDFPESVNVKAGRIQKSAILSSFFSHCKADLKNAFIYDGGKFNLLGVDMTKIDQFRAMLKSTGFDFDQPTLVLR